MAVKQILVGKAGSSATPLTLIKGDSNTQIIEMIVDRYYGGVDLEGLAWSVTAENAEGASDEYKAIKASVSDAGVIIQWKVTGTATAAVGITKFKLSGYTQDEGNVLIWQSGDYFIRINDTFEHVPGAEAQAALTEVQKLIVYVDGELSGVIKAGKDAEAAAIAANKAADRANSVADGKNEGRITALEQFTTKPGEPYSVSGSMVRLDNFEGMPMNVVTRIEPVQSGSGDPYPGGGGKNLLKNTATTQTVNGVTFTVNADGTITANGTTTERAQLKVGEVDLPAGDYIVSKGFLTTNNDFAYLVYLVDGAAKYINVADEELAFTFTESTNLMYFVDIRDAGVTANNLKYYPMIRLASITDSTYAPYSNIRPISGHGGAKLTRYGKNLLNPKLVGGNEVYASVTSDGRWRINNTSGGAIYLTNEWVNLPAGNYCFQTDSNVPNLLVYIQKNSDDYSVYISDGIQTKTVYVSDGEQVRVLCAVPAGTSTTVSIWAAKGANSTHYEPYQGDTFSADFGKNLLPNTATTKTVNGVTFMVNADGSVKVKGTATATAQLIVGKYNLPHGDYIINGGAPNVSCYTQLSGANGTVYKDSQGKDVALTLSGDAQGDTVMLQVVSGKTVDATVYPMIRLASIADATYAPYNAALLAKTGGAVYGGTLDWNTGVLTVDRGVLTYDGSDDENWTEASNGRAYIQVSGVGLPPNNDRVVGAICDTLPEVTGNALYNQPDKLGFCIRVGSDIGIRLGKSYGIADTLAALQASPIQICYKLATPITIQLTPQDIHALQGENNIWSSAGEVTVSGRRDVLWLTGHLIDKIRTLEEAIVSMGGNV